MQGAELMSKYGVNVPPGIPVFKLDEVKAAAEEMASPDGEVRGKLLQVIVPTAVSPCKGLGKHGCPVTALGDTLCLHLCSRGVKPDRVVSDNARLWPWRQVVVKSQILAGGRGLGHFTNGLKGGVHIVKAADAPALAEKMLGGTLVGSWALLQAPARLLLRRLSLGESPVPAMLTASLA